ncbi:hypothetical protein PUNSTDRAFT_55625 [Punctularia strigosozonata HHB-11173 SS5]|uniref:Cytosolic endo-beta-N-acetylglucosaminidase TIM barrel domain-containing protein n=1 Tax=Punctularia strigosozonata (strain HHB-11173) TaxID=741275 RepID=R7S3C2_PUNST|nr:uncharacterized protein PUNSTDRAFT_55625 [Punctularia strigosozonata HHB-11173 SS5]EIN04359.1 hypothetical protein PUNSTDRAFT_55625 [Punctularia strigosozonata HHB-11173 SS5]
MPLLGTDHSILVKDEAPFFRSLAELDDWASKPSPKLGAVLPYTPRRPVPGPQAHQGKLLVCHDYKGGYTESTSAHGYTFNFWPLCDSFIYFSHHRVTIPPPGWSTAAHRQGVKMLGTLIFEGDGEADCLRLLVGRLPSNVTGSSAGDTLPFSPYYARVLADLAYQRGFDGYLLNFECPLRGGLEQTRALTAWIALLDAELKSKVGPHAETIWYDSVVVTGQLRWQDRLNSLNLPFFLPSTAFFTNYTWPAHYPNLTASYFLSLAQASLAQLRTQPKTLNSVYVGVDVWGRGQHGGGGLGSYRALAHIDPLGLGLSAALFGPAWTWESEQDKPGFDWQTWWKYERLLWVGPEDEQGRPDVPEAPRREGEPVHDHGPFEPIANYFGRRAPPDPLDVAFCTTFCPGVGNAWWVEGVKVMDKAATGGWTDVDKQTSLGDLVWPRAAVTWEAENDQPPRTDVLPTATSSIFFEDAWTGGSSLRLSFSCPGSDAEDAFFRCLWVPVQSAALSSQMPYHVTLVYKVDAQEDDAQVEVDLGLSIKILAPDGKAHHNLNVSPVSTDQAIDLPGGWSRTTVQLTLSADQCELARDGVAIGLALGFAVEDPTQSYKFSVVLGQLAVYPAPLTAPLSQTNPKVLWASYTPGTAPASAGVLEWETAASLPTLPSLSITSPDDPIPAWILDYSQRQTPAFSYFNIYVQARTPLAPSVPLPGQATFIGTTGLDGRLHRFFVDDACLPEALQGIGVRFYVQGVTDRGRALKWDRCAFVDVQLPK